MTQENAIANIYVALSTLSTLPPFLHCSQLTNSTNFLESERLSLKNDFYVFQIFDFDEKHFERKNKAVEPFSDKLLD